MNKPNLRLLILNDSNWLDYKEALLNDEQQFHPSIRTEEAEYHSIIKSPNTLALMALVDQKYAGNAIAKRLNKDDRKELKLLDQVSKPNEIYLHNFSVNPSFQGQGIGLALLKALITNLKQQGFSHLNGHFRENGSLATLLKLGGKSLRIEENWFNTGENYHYCELDLSLAHFSDM